MDYGLWQPFYSEDVEDEVHNGIHILMSFQCNHLSSIAFSFFFQEDLPPSPVTMHLLPAPDLGKQAKNQEEDENKPSLKIPDKLASSQPRRRNYGRRDRQAVRRTRKRTSPRMLTPTWKSFSPAKLLRKAKMMLRSVQSE